MDDGADAADEDGVSGRGVGCVEHGLSLLRNDSTIFLHVFFLYSAISGVIALSSDYICCTFPAYTSGLRQPSSPQHPLFTPHAESNIYNADIDGPLLPLLHPCVSIPSIMRGLGHGTLALAD